MNILITGAAGFVGKNLSAALAAALAGAILTGRKQYAYTEWKKL